MSTIMNDNSSIIDPQAEVKKLQDLVKKLEQQNQILRSKHQRDNNTVITTKSEDINTNFTKTTTRSEKDGIDNLKARVGNITLEDVELLDIEEECTEEDDNWLYASPKRPSPAQKSVSPYKWVRQEFEHPSAELETAKKSLFYKLEEVSNRISRSSSSGTVGSITSPTGPVILSNSGPGEVHHGLAGAQAQGGMPTFKQPVTVFGLDHLSSFSTRVDTGTFTRPKNKKHKSRLLGAVEHVERPAVEDSPMSQGEDDPDGLDDSTGSHKLANVSDVQTLARMQEESLRQSFTSPISSPRKSLSRSLNKSGFFLPDGDSPSPQNSARSSPGRFDNDTYQLIHQSNQSLGSMSSASEASTPPDSPHSSNQHLDHRPSQHYNHRKSLPNLSRLSTAKSIPSRGSESNLRDSPPRKTGLSGHRQRMPGSGARQLSPGRAMSPQRSGIPSPRSSGIPRPGSASRLPTPRSRSGIPSPRTQGGGGRDLDDSWKEGCF